MIGDFPIQFSIYTNCLLDHVFLAWEACAYQSLREACAILGFLSGGQSQLISSYVFCMILAKFFELRTHLLIFDYS